MSRSFDVQINARRIMFVKSYINVIIITLFYTNCTRGLATYAILKLSKQFSIGGGAAPAPL